MYLRGWFSIDFFSTIPYGRLASAFGSGNSTGAVRPGRAAFFFFQWADLEVPCMALKNEISQTSVVNTSFFVVHF